MDFKLIKEDQSSKARAGEITTDHGVIQTPIFMPVGTLGSVKGINYTELTDTIAAQIILGNTYHLYLRPGCDILKQAGGLHSFMGWDLPILTDSGGYQVYSLSPTRKITEEGVQFKSHIDGSTRFISPESAMDIQRIIGADIIMAFDECTPYPCEYEYARKSMEMTHRWLKRCKAQFERTVPIYGHKQSLFPIIQGSTFKNLRKQSAEVVASMDFEANAIGGLSVGEPAEDMYAMTDIVCNILPKEKPRYLMGVGTPENLLECIALGIDMFDCVMPTRNGRNGMLFTAEGFINIKNKKWENDFSPIDLSSPSHLSQHHTKAYLRHLIVSKERLGGQIASIHNLSFYLWLVREARKYIINGDFVAWKNNMVKRVTTRL